MPYSICSTSRRNKTGPLFVYKVHSYIRPRFTVLLNKEILVKQIATGLACLALLLVASSANAGKKAAKESAPQVGAANVYVLNVSGIT